VGSSSPEPFAFLDASAAPPCGHWRHLHSAAMPPKDRGLMPPPAAKGGGGKGRGGGGAKGGGKGKGGGDSAASRISSMDDRSVEAQSNIEILRSQRGANRRGGPTIRDTVRDNEGMDEADPAMAVDDGIRLEPFNMRREMNEGHFDEGGFYVLNKDEEKQVTDAWLDTVDHAQKTAAFKREEEKKKAAAAAARRISAISKNLKEGGDDDDEEEKDEEDDADAKEDDEKEAPKPEEPAEEEPEEDAVAMLEELISVLMPLETPTEALARLARQAKAGGAELSAKDSLPALKMRSRVRQARAANDAAAKAQAAASAQAGAAKPKKRRFDEWGYQEGAAAESKAPSVTTAAAKSGESGAAGDSADGAKSSLGSDAAVAAAAEKLATKEKAEQEAAAAFASEMKVTRHVLREFAGVEANAILNLNADDVCKSRKKEGEEEEERDAKPEAEQAEEEPEAPAAKRQKKDASDWQKECRRKIEKLTELSDSLLQKGVNVYDSTRELLAIECRERKGEKLVDEGEEGAGAGKDAAPATEEAAKSTPAESGDAGKEAPATGSAAAVPAPIQYDNKRLSVGGGSAVVDADKFESAGPSEQQLFWQFRWKATPDLINGPFDSVTMQGWMTQGCFAEERPAEIRQCDAANQGLESCWHSWEKIDFELYL